ETGGAQNGPGMRRAVSPAPINRRRIQTSAGGFFHTTVRLERLALDYRAFPFSLSLNHCRLPWLVRRPANSGSYSPRGLRILLLPHPRSLPSRRSGGVPFFPPKANPVSGGLVTSPSSPWPAEPVPHIRRPIPSPSGNPPAPPER